MPVAIDAAPAIVLYRAPGDGGLGQGLITATGKSLYLEPMLGMVAHNAIGKRRADRVPRIGIDMHADGGILHDTPGQVAAGAARYKVEASPNRRVPVSPDRR